MVVRRIEERVGRVIPERCDHGMSDRPRPSEPELIERQLVEREKPECDGRMILEKAGYARAPVLPRSEHAAIAHHFTRQELTGAKGGRAPVVPRKSARAV